MRPQDVVAIILAVGVIAILLSGTSMQFLWHEPEDYVMAHSADSPEELVFWKDVINVMIGALAGYIAGRGSERK